MKTNKTSLKENHQNYTKKWQSFVKFFLRPRRFMRWTTNLWTRHIWFSSTISSLTLSPFRDLKNPRMTLQGRFLSALLCLNKPLKHPPYHTKVLSGVQRKGPQAPAWLSRQTLSWSRHYFPPSWSLHSSWKTAAGMGLPHPAPSSFSSTKCRSWKDNFKRSSWL